MREPADSAEAVRQRDREHRERRNLTEKCRQLDAEINQHLAEQQRRRAERQDNEP